MANWTTLKAAITDVIKTNGNQEITGAVLQSTLISIVNSVGENATFAGVATPATNPGTPDGPVFYLASQIGAYNNFNGLSVNIGEIAIFIYKTSWQKQSLSYEITEVNVSKIFPTGGIDGTNKYTLETAIAMIPASLRNVGIKCSFLDEGGEVETWVYMNGTFTDTVSWERSGFDKELNEAVYYANFDVAEISTNYYESSPILVKPKTKIIIHTNSINNSSYSEWYDINGASLGKLPRIDDLDYETEVPENAYYVVIRSYQKADSMSLRYENKFDNYLNQADAYKLSKTVEWTKYVEKDYKPTDSILVNSSINDQAPKIDVSKADYVSICTTMNFSNQNPIVIFYNSSDGIVKSLTLSDFTALSNSLKVKDEIPTDGASYMKIIGWNKAVFNENIDSMYVKVYERLADILTELENNSGGDGSSEEEEEIVREYDPSGYIYTEGYNDLAMQSAPAIDISRAHKVSVCTVMNFMTTFPVISFYNSGGGIVKSIMYSELENAGGPLRKATDIPTDGAVTMRIVAWNQAAFDENVDNLYIKVYEYKSEEDERIGNLDELTTFNKETLVAAINEINGKSIENVSSKILTTDDIVKQIDNCNGDYKSFTVHTAWSDRKLICFNVGANANVHIKDLPHIYSLAATKEIPEKGPTGTTQMAQFGSSEIVKNEYVTMPSGKPYFVAFVSVSANVDDMFEVIGLYERIGALEYADFNFFSGKKIAFVGDSLMADGDKVPKNIAMLLGLVYNSDENEYTSKGGTQTLEDLRPDLCGQMRARNLENYDDPDIIIVENVNDGNGEDYTDEEMGDVEPFMLSSYTDIDSNVANKQAAIDYFGTNFSTIISGQSPVVGKMIRVPYTTQSYDVEITKKASHSGEISIVVDEISYSVEVASNDTTVQIAEKLAAYQFGDLTVKYTPGSSSLTLVNGSDTVVSTVIFNAGNTGTAATVTPNSSISYVGFCFYSHDVSEWTTKSKWIQTANVPLLAAYKGLIEYLMTTFPKAWVFWMLPNRYQINWSNPTLQAQSLLREDGSLDYDKFIKLNAWTAPRNKRIRKWMDYLCVPVLDLEKECSMTLWNASTYFPSNNVHANQSDEGAMRWAQAAVRCML